MLEIDKWWQRAGPSAADFPAGLILPGWPSESLMSAQSQCDDRGKQLGPSRGGVPVMTSSVGPFDRAMASVASLLRVEVLGLPSLGGMEGVCVVVN